MSPAALDAIASIRALDVEGALTTGVVRPALVRIESSLRACYRSAARRSGRGAPTSVRVSFELAESRAPRGISVGSAAMPGLSDCIATAVGRARTRVVPDIGRTKVTFTIRFSAVEQ